ncbi:hypothetical protein ACK8P5_03385 [Paenibacillus sp. EC2-1]|uniref:hypothetical protein n=1 Tax=Paenibacillus sp. EC2-1 TaxID=3388665 RepID=UPI003BEEF53F
MNLLSPENSGLFYAVSRYKLINGSGDVPNRQRDQIKVGLSLYGGRNAARSLVCPYQISSITLLLGIASIFTGLLYLYADAQKEVRLRYEFRLKRWFIARNHLPDWMDMVIYP